MNGQVSIGPEFFKRIRRDYRDWKMAFFRELIQNSVDAGSKNIFFTTNREENKIICEDDGCGMDKDIIINKFLVLGETTKTDGQTIGGFGRAREIICFANKAYEIKTKNIFVKGSGSNFTVEEVNEYQKGCKISIWFDKEEDVERIKNEGIKYIGDCRIYNVDIYHDGIKYESKFPRRMQEFTTFDWGRLVVTKKIHDPFFYVMVRGVMMFKEWIGSDFSHRVVAEITDPNPCNVLTSTRDSLVYEKMKDLSDVVSKFKTCPKSVLIKNQETETIWTGEKGKITSFEEGKDYAVTADTIRYRNGFIATVKDNMPNFQYKNNIVKGLPDIMVQRTGNYAWHRSWLPDHMNSSGAKILAMWAYTLKEVARVCNIVVKFGVGLILDKEPDASLAMYKNKDNNNWFLINPYRKGKKGFKGFGKDTFYSLWISACHELAHLTNEYHDESFIEKMEHIMETSMKHFKEIYKSVIYDMRDSVSDFCGEDKESVEESALV
ncbi:MAG: ATP-binding protein [Nanoarchaeota archaeon]